MVYGPARTLRHPTQEVRAHPFQPTFSDATDFTQTSSGCSRWFCFGDTMVCQDKLCWEHVCQDSSAGSTGAPHAHWLALQRLPQRSSNAQIRPGLAAPGGANAHARSSHRVFEFGNFIVCQDRLRILSLRTANCIIIDHFSAFESGLVAPFLYAAS